FLQPISLCYVKLYLPIRKQSTSASYLFHCPPRLSLEDTTVLYKDASSVCELSPALDSTLQHLSSADYKYTPMVTDHRYFTESSAMETNLTILQMTEEDVGTYYCGIFKSRDVVFGSGTVLEIEGESEPVQSVLQSPEYIRAQPGDSVTLSCSFTSSQHQQEHTRVMWVKTGSDSQIISLKYGKENIFCEDTEEASCVHNLTLKDISSAEDGTYLCVVTACGDTLIGNATTIHVNGPFDLSTTVIALTVSNVVLGMAVVVLVWVVSPNLLQRPMPVLVVETWYCIFVYWVLVKCKPIFTSPVFLLFL
uniref:Ig-like domain-containing protein n=1 Tax=Neogobius melanostomus TaxID=47308 RepID=A0A8C6WJH0_9GOBI